MDTLTGRNMAMENSYGLTGPFFEVIGQKDNSMVSERLQKMEEQDVENGDSEN